MMTMAATMHPIWQSGGVILVGAVLGALLLQLLVHHFLPAAVRQRHTELGAAIFSVIGTTYAVLLAFMAMTAWEQYSAAEGLARHEADLVASSYDASHGLPDSVGAALRANLTAYMRRVVEVEWPSQVAGDGIAPSEPLLAQVRRSVLAMTPADTSQANVQIFLVGMLSDVATARRDRRLAMHGTIPDLVWIVLVVGGALMVGFSFVLGAPTRSLHLVMTAALVASGILVLLLIVGLSSPFHGAVSISPEAYRAVLAEMREVP